jgi:Protein of unknown function (DUF2924)
MHRSRSLARAVNNVSVEDEIARLRDLDVHSLRARWRAVFWRKPPPHLPRHLLFAILAYRLQADQAGDLAPDTIRLLKQIVTTGNTARVQDLAAEFDRRRTGVRPGTVLMREWNRQSHRVMVLDDGFAWNGKTYESLSKVAFAITGTKWNGPRFFGLREKLSAAAEP